MSKGLAKTYSKEIIKELDKIPVYFPGENVEIGDVITFGKSFFKPRPLGSFQQITDLDSLGIKFEIEKDTTPDSYVYASRKGVEVNFVAEANAGSGVKGKTTINFKKEGSIYFAGVNCLSDHMKSTAHLKAELDKHKNAIDWKNCFIVTGLTIAEKALISQSSSDSASINIEGDVKGFQTGGAKDLSAKAKFSITKSGSTAFLKDWSSDVTVFFTLMRYRKRLFGGSNLDAKAMYINKEDDEYELFTIQAEDLFMEE
ncbi:MAG: hypothetical protein ACI8ZM_000247 [Crocinitomix sp.]|jgi:hypothetical protein